MLTHTKEKPHECEFCRKKFSQKSNLNAQVRTHTGDRAFGCDVELQQVQVEIDICIRINNKTD